MANRANSTPAARRSRADASLNAAIEAHRDNDARWVALLPLLDERDPRFDPTGSAEVEAAERAEIAADLLLGIIHHPVHTVGALVAKARYLAAIDSRGELDVTMATEFLRSIADEAVLA